MRLVGKITEFTTGGCSVAEYAYRENIGRLIRTTFNATILFLLLLAALKPRKHQ
jgi:hypothetical protein